ncbi:hypothetical protein C8R46DRAFT_1227741 [Mycena filopes]|nr:hypothetical protein C8R46DRAFT_1227741 [Mycena filopes]
MATLTVPHSYDARWPVCGRDASTLSLGRYALARPYSHPDTTTDAHPRPRPRPRFHLHPDASSPSFHVCPSTLSHAQYPYPHPRPYPSRPVISLRPIIPRRTIQPRPSARVPAPASTLSHGHGLPLALSKRPHPHLVSSSLGLRSGTGTPSVPELTYRALRGAASVGWLCPRPSARTVRDTHIRGRCHSGIAARRISLLLGHFTLLPTHTYYARASPCFESLDILFGGGGGQ